MPINNDIRFRYPRSGPKQVMFVGYGKTQLLVQRKNVAMKKDNIIICSYNI